MATHDYIISNASGAAVRADLNNALAAIATNNSSATEPTTTYAYQWWADTGSSPTVMKLRNAANSGWVTLFQLDGEWSLIPFENGTAAAPSIYFKDSGTDTGIYSPGADQVAITTGGTQRATVDSSGRLLVGTSSARTKFYAGNATFTPAFQVERAASTNDRGTSFVYNSNDVECPIVILGKSRGTSTGSFTVVQNGDLIGRLSFQGADGTNLVEGATIDAFVDNAPGSNDLPTALRFSTTADGASSPTERMRIRSDGIVFIPAAYGATTANAANLNVATDGALQRSTSSIKYKTNVETLQDQYADALLNVRPVWYRSTCAADCPEHSWWGFIAEEVAEIDPRLVQWKTTEPVEQEDGSIEHVPCNPEPEGVAYDRFVPHLLNLIKRQKEQIEAMEARLSALEGA